MHQTRVLSLTYVISEPDKPLKCFHSSKKGNKMKKAVSQMKNGPGPVQDRDVVTTVQKVSD